MPFKRRSASLFSCGLVAAIIMWPISTPHGGQFPPCQKNFFYDDVTEKCEPCRGICYQAEHRKSEDDCARLCPDYEFPGKKAPGDTGPAPARYLSDSATATIASATVGVAVCVFVILYVKKGQRFADIWRRARGAPAGASPADREASQSLRLGVREEGDGSAGSLHDGDTSLHVAVHQESENGRLGAQEIALVGSSAGSSLNENVEPKTFHDSAIFPTQPSPLVALYAVQQIPSSGNIGVAGDGPTTGSRVVSD